VTEMLVILPLNVS